MATQIYRVLEGVWVGLHTCTLGTFLLYPMTLSMPICDKKLHSTRAVESHKLFIVVTLLQWKVSDFLQPVSGVIFCCKSAYLEPRGITKTSSTYKYVTPPNHPCPAKHLFCSVYMKNTRLSRFLVLWVQAFVFFSTTNDALKIVQTNYPGNFSPFLTKLF